MALSDHPHGHGRASDWILRWHHLALPGGTALDIACGYGRHVQWLSSRGHPVTGIDRAPEALQSLAARAAGGQVELVEADIEQGPWPLMSGQVPRQFDIVLVTNYLWRPLWPTVLASLAPGGLLLYETFAEGNASVGKPSRPDFLLRHGELLELCRHLRIVAYENGFCDAPARFVQRIAAINAKVEPPDPVSYPREPARHRLPS